MIIANGQVDLESFRGLLARIDRIAYVPTKVSPHVVHVNSILRQAFVTRGYKNAQRTSMPPVNSRQAIVGMTY